MWNVPELNEDSSSTWKTFWRRMRSHTMPPNQWCAWTRSRLRCTPTFDRRLQPNRDERQGAIANTSAEAQPMFSVRQNQKRATTLPSPRRIAPDSNLRAWCAKLAMQHPGAQSVHFVMDNLNIHGCKSLTDAFGDDMGAEIRDRFTVHHTPAHGSWLNQAEIEIGMFARQCLGTRRIPDLRTLRLETSAWGSADQPRPNQD
jgi:DDE superfamily endonuclease